MRNAFAAKITELAEQDQRIVVLSGDIGNRLFDKYKQKFPERFYNCGVAEANMISVAAGMAIDGLRPFVYTITPFLTSRCYEQIKIDLCYHDLPVTLVGVGGGLSYAELGPTHHSFEDLAILRVLPRMGILAPADEWEVKVCLESALAGEHPTYIRLGKKGEPALHQNLPSIGLGKSCILQQGKKICLLTAGPILNEVIKAAAILETSLGFPVTIVSFPSIKPLDKDLLQKLTVPEELLVTVEEHSLIGGLGSAVNEWLADNGSKRQVNLLRLGLPDEFYCQGGSQAEARKNCGLSADMMAETIKKTYEQKIAVVTK